MTASRIKHDRVRVLLFNRVLKGRIHVVDDNMARGPSFAARIAAIVGQALDDSAASFETSLAGDVEGLRHRRLRRQASKPYQGDKPFGHRISPDDIAATIADSEKADRRPVILSAFTVRWRSHPPP
jgi:hypothetical protein